jgi:hypothetical protein
VPKERWDESARSAVQWSEEIQQERVNRIQDAEIGKREVERHSGFSASILCRRFATADLKKLVLVRNTLYSKEKKNNLLGMFSD